ncbi:MAG: HdeD family acid-resistance protein [Gemmataceae bacterium]
MTSAFPYFLSHLPEEVAALRRKWAAILALGVVMTVVGLLAIAYPAVATITTVQVFGVLLVIAGVSEIVGGLWAGRLGALALHVLCGLVALFVGAAILDNPLLGAKGYTLVLAVFFVAAGAARVVFALTQRFSGWGWVLLNGGVSLLLGMLIWRELPYSSLWAIGTFVGIDLMFNGLSWVMIAVAVRRVIPRPAAADAPALA